MARKKKEDKVVESSVQKEVPELTEEDQAQAEEAQRQGRITACNQEISAALQKHGCTLDASVVLRAGQVMPNIQIVPVELMKKPGDVV